MASGTDPEDNRPTTTPPGVERPAEHRTFLIADIRGYTRYTDEHGDEAAAALAARFAGLVRDAVEARDGVLLELRGDEALTIFASARQAVRAAVELQQRIATEDLPRGVGVGLDTGEAVPVEGGYRGSALNVAARLCSQARAHEILASETVVHLAARIEGIRYGDPRTMRVKGLGQPVRVVTVEADSGPRSRRATIRRSATAATIGRPAVGLAAVLGVVIVAAAVWVGAVPGLGPGASPMPSSSPAAVGSPVRASAGSSPVATSSPTRLPPSPVTSYKGGLNRSAVMPGPGPEDEFEKRPTVRWQFPATAAMGSSPSVVNDQVYVGDMAGMLHVLDFATGKEAWSFDAGAPVTTTPTVVEGSVYLTTVDGRFQAIDLASHQRRWEVAGAASTATPTVVREEAYVGLASGRFEALSAVDGHELWHVDLDGDAALNAVSLDSAFVSSAKTNRLYAIDLKTHGIRWTASTGAKGVLTPAVYDGTVYVVATDAAGKNSHVTAFGAQTGAEQWRWASPDHGSLSTLVVTSRFVYTTSDSPGGTTLWAVERFSGQLAWLKQLKIGPIQPSMVQDHMYLATAAGSVRAIEAIDGDGLETWNLTPGGPAVGAPVVTGGLVLVATAPGGSDPGSLWAIGSGDDAIPSADPDAWAWVADLVAADDQPALYLNVAVDSKGNVYAADRFFNRVVIWDKAGKDQIWGRFGTGKGEFDFGGVTPGDQSQSVAIAADGRIAVGDGGNHRVQIFDSKRKFIRAIGREGAAPGQFINPCCVAFDPEGRLYVADPGRNDIQVFDKAGKFVRIIGSPGSGNAQFDRLGVPYIDPATGLLWVPDFANRRVEVVGPDGSFIATYGDGANRNPTLAEVNGVALDAAGRMFVVDTDQFVWVLDSGGKLITRLGPTIPGHGSVGPAFIVLTPDGKLYLPDAQVGSNRVVVMQLKPPLWPPP